MEIMFKGKRRFVVDETPTHYICDPDNRLEGYHYISKDLATMIPEKTFLELLQSGEELDCDLIIGDCDMPATFVWGEGCKITEYGIEKFKPIMDAKLRRIPNGNIEIFCDDYKLGERFVMAAAGYISESEWNKMFRYFETEDSPDITTTEVCPHCDEEVEIPENKASNCPSCGEKILPCSTCWGVRDNKVKCDWTEKEKCWRFPSKEE